MHDAANHLIQSLKTIRNDLNGLDPDDRDSLIQLGAALEEATDAIPDEKEDLIALFSLCGKGLQAIYQGAVPDTLPLTRAIAGATVAAEQRLLTPPNPVSERMIAQTAQTLHKLLAHDEMDEPDNASSPEDTAEASPPRAASSDEASSDEAGTLPSDAQSDESVPTYGDDIIQEFLVESYENLDQLDQDFIALEQDPTAQETLASVFRIIHTIKGTCGFLNFPKLEKLAHVGENLLSRLRDGELHLTSDMTSTLLSMADAVRDMLSNIEMTRQEGETDYTALIEQLSRLEQGDRTASSTTHPATSSEEEPAALDVAERFGEALVKRGRVQPDEVTAARREQEGGDPRHIGEILVEQGVLRPQDVTETLKAQGEAHKPGLAENSIRVDVGLLDKLMTLVGELVLARNQVLQFTATERDSTFIGTSQRLNLITTELQEGVMKTRMQPIGNIWNKFPRVVRDLAISCGKKVQIEMEGNDTELDKTILEAIKDPLTHLIRNAVDHGIENPDTRAARGKPPEGRIFLRAFHEGGQVNIEISDDGAGIHAEQVRQKALRRNVITPEQAARMSDRELINLIFRPGFSTADTVTNVSGRGVGMDVVKTNIEKIGGMVDIQSEAGQGASIKIKIPLTLAIIPALIVTSGGDSYAIPQVGLLELVRLEGRESRTGIETIHGAPVYRLRGDLLPLVYLHEQLDLDAAHQASDGDGAGEAGIVNIVVLQADDRPFGLVVEHINDTEEIVVKPLGKQLKSIETFAGTTIMGDGKVALILDVMGIAQRAGVIAEVRNRRASETEIGPQEHADQSQAMLLFSVSETDQVAIPLAMVARLEEFPASRIEWAGGQRVVQYRDQILPLIFLADVLQAAPPEAETDPLRVIVYAEPHGSVGLVIDRIIDIVDETVTVQHAINRDGLLGSTVIQGRVTDLLDVHEIIEMAIPAFFDRTAA